MMMISRGLCVIALLVVLSACASDEEKLTMLKGDYFTADMLSQTYERKFDSVLVADNNQAMRKPLSPAAKAYGDSSSTWRIKKDLAERELNRFMR
jgi:hypothetical protein